MTSPFFNWLLFQLTNDYVAYAIEQMRNVDKVFESEQLGQVRLALVYDLETGNIYFTQRTKSNKSALFDIRKEEFSLNLQNL